jgi:hypothetical protein
VKALDEALMQVLYSYHSNLGQAERHAELYNNQQYLLLYILPQVQQLLCNCPKDWNKSFWLCYQHSI